MLTSARSAMTLAKGVATGDQGDNLRVIHTHSAEGLTNVQGRRFWVTIAVGALRVDVDEAHMSSCKRLLQLASTGGKVGTAVVPDVITFGHEGCLSTPEDALIRLPRIGPTSTKAEDREAELLEGRVAGQEDQVCPRDGFAILLLDGPQQAPCLVEVGIVRPAIERSEALLALQVEYSD
jgi:hypothetical protein